MEIRAMQRKCLKCGKTYKGNPPGGLFFCKHCGGTEYKLEEPGSGNLLQAVLELVKEKKK